MRKKEQGIKYGKQKKIISYVCSDVMLTHLAKYKHSPA